MKFLTGFGDIIYRYIWYTRWRTRWWFHICLFSLLFGDDSQFDEHIFQRGWFNHQPVYVDAVEKTIYFTLTASSSFVSDEIDGCTEIDLNSNRHLRHQWILVEHLFLNI